MTRRETYHSLPPFKYAVSISPSSLQYYRSSNLITDTQQLPAQVGSVHYHNLQQVEISDAPIVAVTMIN